MECNLVVVLVYSTVVQMNTIRIVHTCQSLVNEMYVQQATASSHSNDGKTPHGTDSV